MSTRAQLLVFSCQPPPSGTPTIVFIRTLKSDRYLKGKVVLSICMQTRKGYSENCTVVMKSRVASVSKPTSTPALTKSVSTVTLPMTTNAPLHTMSRMSLESALKKSREGKACCPDPYTCPCLS